MTNLSGLTALFGFLILAFGAGWICAPAWRQYADRKAELAAGNMDQIVPLTILRLQRRLAAFTWLSLLLGVLLAAMIFRAAAI